MIYKKNWKNRNSRDFFVFWLSLFLTPKTSDKQKTQEIPYDFQKKTEKAKQ